MLRQSNRLRKGRQERDSCPLAPVPSRGPQRKPTQSLAISSWALTCCRKKLEDLAWEGTALGLSHCLPKVT